ncbi:MAG: hypothetical protein RI907_1057 [Pseudomonadota bacterium]|jgi:hypothetical protein
MLAARTLIPLMAMSLIGWASTAHASLGDAIVVKADGNVLITFEGSDAGFDSTVSINGAAPIFPNHSTAVGTTIDLGFFTAGSVIDARLLVDSAGYVFHTGPGTLNSDGQPHALLIDNWNNTGRTFVGFEDIPGTLAGTGDYNDHTFSFTNVVSSPVPEPSAVAMMAIGACLVGASRRRGQR